MSPVPLNRKDGVSNAKSFTKGRKSSLNQIIIEEENSHKKD